MKVHQHMNLQLQQLKQQLIRGVLSTKRVNGPQTMFNWRHLEVNFSIIAGVFLPITESVLTHTLLENPYLWRFLLVEFHTYFKA